MLNTFLLKATHLALLIATVAVLASPERARAQIYLFDIVTGQLSSGPHEFFTFPGSPPSWGAIRGRFAGLRDSQDAIWWRFPDPSDLLVFNSLTPGPANFLTFPQIAGGDFDGLEIQDVPVNSHIGTRDDVTGAPFALLGLSGINTYVINFPTATALVAQHNPTLSSGDFDGMRFSDVPADAYVGYRLTGLAQIAIRGPNGINIYDIVAGGLSDLRDPVISGGPFDGMRFSELSSDDFVGFRDTAGSEIALVPEPSTMHGSIVAMGVLASMGRRRRRRPLSFMSSRCFSAIAAG